MAKNIVIYYGDLIYSFNGKYYCKPGLGRFIDEMSTKYKKIFYTTTIEESSFENISNYYQIKANNILYQNVPNNNSFLASVKNRSKINKTLKKNMKEWKEAILYLRWPTPNVYNVYKLAHRNKMRVFLHVVKDPYTIVKGTTKYKGIKRIFALIYSKLEENKIKKIMKSTPTIINGNAQRRLYTKKTNVLELISATLNKEEIVLERTYNKTNKKILYVGVLKEEKGVDILLDVYKTLLTKYEKIELNIVGDGPEKKFLENKAKELSISDKVYFHGYVPLGYELKKLYLESDLFVLPSRSEGTPRVLIEAMSFGLPIVASNVGGVPFTIKHGYNGLLSNDKADFIENILLLIKDSAIRRTIVSNGYKTSTNNTIESFVNKIYTFINNNGE